MKNILKGVLISLFLVSTAFSADWRELDTVINYDTGKTDYILDIDNLKSNIITSGNIGVGTTNPAYNLQVIGTFDATTITENGSALTNYWTRTGTNVYPATITDNIGIGTTAPLGLLQVGTSPTPGLLVTSSGNVGIGTTGPAYLLDVNGTANFSGAVTGIALNEIENLTTDKSFSNGNNSLSFNFVAPSGQPTFDGAFEIQASGAFTGHLLHVHQHTGNPGATHLVHLETEDADVLPLCVIGTGNVSATFSGGNVGIGNTAPVALLDIGTSPGVGLLVFSSGNVGIGNTNPIHLLDVNGITRLNGNVGIGAVATNYALYVNGDTYITGDSYQGDQYNVTGNMGALGNLGVGTTAPRFKVDVIGSSSIFAFTGGNMGIGTTAPSQVLQVVGTVAGTTITGANVTSGADPGHTHTGTSLSDIDISADTNLAGDTENVLTDDALSIGSTITRDTEWNGLDFLVGTATGTLSGEIIAGTAPGGELGGTWASPTIDDSLAVTSWTLTTPILSGIFNTDNNYLSGDGGAEGLMIDDAGNVGIGRTAPTALLQVSSTANQNLFSVEDGGVGDSSAFVIDATGQVGIGTTVPTQKLDVRGNIVIQSGNYYMGVGDASITLGDNINDQVSIKTGVGDNFYIFTNTVPTAVLTVTSDSNVGIGTSSPQAKLEVKGNILSDNTCPMMGLQIVNPVTSMQPFWKKMPMNYRADRVTTTLLGGSEVQYTLKVGTNHTSPTGTLATGTLANNSLTVTNLGAVGDTAPQGTYLIFDITSTANSDTGTQCGLQVDGRIIQ